MPEICLPRFGSCDPTSRRDDEGGGNPYYIDCANSWNANNCQNDKCWFMPYKAGDVISAYTPNGSPTIVTVTELDGVTTIDATVTTTDTEDGGKIIQVSTEYDGCFKINQSNSRYSYCYGWEFAPIICDRPTIKIRGIYKDGEEDCFGIPYPFDNSIRLYGYLLEGKRSDIEKTIYGDHVKKRKVTSYWTLYINDAVPPVIHRVLARQLLAANQIEIEQNGVTYTFETDPSFTLQSTDIKSRMFHYDKSIQLRYVCEVQGKC